MLRTNVYLTEKQKKEITLRAAMNKKPKAAVLRDIIDHGLKAIPLNISPSSIGFMKLGKAATRFKGKIKGPKDLSQNIDKYLWDNHE